MFNPGSYLTGAIDSVLAQSFTDYELLVVDDASTQPVGTIVTSYHGSRLRFEQNPSNLGLVGNWNRCIELASGEYIAIFHQDDLMDFENLAIKTAILDQHPEVGLVYSNILRIDEDSRVVSGHYINQPDQDQIMTGAQLFEMVAKTGNPVACPSVVARKECYEQVGGFDDRLPFATDQEMWLRIARFYSIGYLAQPLVSHRIHKEQETARFSGSGLDYRDILYALDIVFSSDLPIEYAGAGPQAYLTLASQARAMALWKLRKGKLKAAWRYSIVTLLARHRSSSARE